MRAFLRRVGLIAADPWVFVLAVVVGITLLGRDLDAVLAYGRKLEEIDERLRVVATAEDTEGRRGSANNGSPPGMPGS